MLLSVIVTVIASYLLGNLNGAFTASFLFSKDDIRDHGSGNAGLTNYIRQYGYKKAGLVIAVDMGKAIIACLVGRLLLEPYGYGLEGAVLGGLAVSLGHDFPALLGFRGGKGILSGFTVILMIDYRCALIALAVFAVALLLTRYVSLGSMLGALSIAVFMAVVYHDRIWVCLGGMILGITAIIMHRANIMRLIKGTESKFGQKKGKEQEKR